MNATSITSNLTKAVPIGVILPQMGGNQPAGFLKCDGSTYQISSYPDLANYFYNQFGSINYFGGNGSTTFGVPNLQGEFLRGAGANSHADQGSGSAVGVHQDGTVHVLTYNDVNNNNIVFNAITNSSYQIAQKVDMYIAPSSGPGSRGAKYIAYTLDSGNKGTTSNYTSRPTNTSVLFIIKAYYNLI